MVDSPNDALQSHKVAARNSPGGGVGRPRNRENPENSDKLSPAKGGGGVNSGGRPLGNMSTYLRQHRQDIAQTLIVDNPSETLQTHKFPGQNSPRGRVGGQKSLENPEKVVISCPSKAPG